MSEQGQTEGRDERGRFAAGNRGGPGRPPKAREAAYQAVVQEVVSLGAWAKVVAEALVRAQAGDSQARQWLGEFLIGKPKQSLGISLDHSSGADEFEHLSDDELAAAIAAAEAEAARYGEDAGGAGAAGGSAGGGVAAGGGSPASD